MTYEKVITITAIIAWNILSCYFWIWLYKEIFHSNITLKVLIKQGLISALGALGIIRFAWIQQLFSKVLIEEGTKTLTSTTANQHQIPSDHIATAILAGIGFAVIENLIYIWYIFDNNLIQISLIRILTNSILHGLFTWLIWFGIFQLLSQKTILKYIYLLLFIWLGIGSHIAYNRSIAQSSIAIWFVFVIIWYIFLSYLLYKSDRLYIS